MRLSTANLRHLKPDVRAPAYDRGRVTPGIVHLGLGAFHRAHQAVYVDDLLARHPGWGIVGASLRSPATRDALEPQDWLYAVRALGGGGAAEGAETRIVGAVVGGLVAPEDPSTLLDAMADPQTRIVTLTVTEKGYLHDPATGEINQDHPDVRHDLAKPGAPAGAIGFLVEALRRRRDAGVPPFTALSCDNLPANGQTLRRVVQGFAELRDPDLAAWIGGEVAFPSSMVDRIVPATTDDDRATTANALGLDDAWPVVTEPFTQWVVEDAFSAGRPPFEEAGVTMTADVEPFERMKLRMLNGAHSTLAYLGYLAGHATVAEAMADANLARLIDGLMRDEAAPTLTMPGGVDLDAYRRALLERFRNPALKHRTWQIAMDGSQKLPQRLLGTIRDRRASGAPFERAALGVAAWMRYALGTDEQGRPIDVRDPLADKLRRIGERRPWEAAALVEGFLALREVFGDDLPADPAFKTAVTGALDRLLRGGAAAAVA